MFTGIIEATGTVERVEPSAGTTRIAIAAPGFAERLRVGDSIAVNGTCLTALEMRPPLFHAELASETLARTTMGMLRPGSVVNLELPTAAGAPLGGHVVQGHVDGRGELISFDPVHADADADATDWWLRVRVPENTARTMVEKGSIAIEGISLTIATWDGEIVGMAILPHTRKVTNLRVLRPGDPVNVEADVMIKLALEQKRQAASFEVTLEYLLANGY
ncbi:MAG TPA: riboflavin synthase [Acidobacteriaceae bacterium]|jgi:riboflavin synthase|nr:riboflavin synthase [Acidobacteriaceae bacterium]